MAFTFFTTDLVGWLILIMFLLTVVCIKLTFVCELFFTCITIVCIWIKVYFTRVIFKTFLCFVQEGTLMAEEFSMRPQEKLFHPV